MREQENNTGKIVQKLDTIAQELKGIKKVLEGTESHLNKSESERSIASLRDTVFIIGGIIFLANNYDHRATQEDILNEMRKQTAAQVHIANPQEFNPNPLPINNNEANESESESESEPDR